VELLYSLFAQTVRTALWEHDDFSIGSCECARPNSYDSQQRQLGLMMMDVCCHPRIINAQMLRELSPCLCMVHFGCGQPLQEVHLFHLCIA
jgi:hypothetical protein